MARSSSYQDQKEVVLDIDGDHASCSKGKENSAESTSQSSRAKFFSSSKMPKVSFEDILEKAVRKRKEDSPDSLWRNLSSSDSFRRNSWRSLVNKTKSRFIDPPDAAEYDESFEEGDHNEEDNLDDISEENKKAPLVLTILQPGMLVLVTVALVCTLSISSLRTKETWDLPLWKWEVFILALISGRLVSGWVTKLIVIFIEHKFLLRQRVLYFVYGLRKAVQNFLWLGLVLLVWRWIFNKNISEIQSNILRYVTEILVCLLVGTFIWLLKTLIVKALASAFHVNTFFERIREALFNQYVIEALSGPPLYAAQNTDEEEESGLGDLQVPLLTKSASRKLDKCPTVGKRPSFSSTMPRKKDESIAIDLLHYLNHKNVSASHMRRMINIVRHGTLSTLHEQILSSNIEDESLFHIRSECQAREAAKKIFLKVAKPGSRCILLDDLMRFMAEEEALRAMRHFGEECDNGGITKTALNNWLVNAFRERRALAFSLNDTKTAVDELHSMLNVVVVIIIAIIWLLILGVPIVHFLVLISSQLLLMAFIFGNTCKTTFEAIIFLFITHPFDVGDCCEVDGDQMLVEEMNILTTTFLRADKQKITYPNSVLAAKPIVNFYRSPYMAESIDFSIHILTPMEKIEMMKGKIKEYIEANGDHWHPSWSVIIMNVEDMKKINMALCVSHTMNCQRMGMGERLIRRSLLLQEMIRLFKELEIEYCLLPFKCQCT